MRIYQSIRKVVAGGAISNRVTVRPALAFSQRVVARVATVAPALRVGVLAALRVPVRTALAVSQRAGGSPRVTVAPALSVSQRVSGIVRAVFAPALVIAQRAAGTLHHAPRVQYRV